MPPVPCGAAFHAHQQGRGRVDKEAGDGQLLGAARDILTTLIRLSHREADYKGFWWGIRPENAGPYFDAVEWEQSKRIAAVLKRAVLDADPDTAAFLRGELARHRVSLAGLPTRPESGPRRRKPRSWSARPTRRTPTRSAT